MPLVQETMTASGLTGRSRSRCATERMATEGTTTTMSSASFTWSRSQVGWMLGARGAAVSDRTGLRLVSASCRACASSGVHRTTSHSRVARTMERAVPQEPAPMTAILCNRFIILLGLFGIEGVFRSVEKPHNVGTVLENNQSPHHREKGNVKYLGRNGPALAKRVEPPSGGDHRHGSHQAGQRTRARAPLKNPAQKRRGPTSSPARAMHW